MEINFLKELNIGFKWSNSYNSYNMQSQKFKV